MGARYNAFDKKCNKLSNDIASVEASILKLQKESSVPALDPAVIILMREVDRMKEKLKRWLDT